MTQEDTEQNTARYLFDVVWSVLFQVYRPPDLQVGLPIQVGGLNEADLQSSKQSSHASTCTAASWKQKIDAK